MCKTYHWEGEGESLLLTLAPGRGKFTYFQLHKKWMPWSTPRGWPGLQMTGLVRWSLFQVTQKWQTKFKVMRERETKFISVFQSNVKTKNKNWNWYPFFKVRRKRKTKSKIQICFSMSCENEKWKWHLNSLFPCHRKMVGTKVHAFSVIKLAP